MTKKYDAIIIGGGVIGCSIAYQLAKSGAKTLLLERERIASQASSAAAGMLGAQAEMITSIPLFELARQSRSLFPSIAKELKERSGIDIGLIQKGLLRIAKTEGEATKLQQTAAFQKSVGEQAEWLTAEQTLGIEPALSANLQGSLSIPNDGQVSAPDLTKAFAASAAALGAEIKEFVEVQEFLFERGRIAGLRTREEVMMSEKIIIASGIGSSSLLKEAKLHMPIYPVKGECFSVLTTRPLLEKTIYTDGCYLVPKKGGEIIVGATVTEHSYDRKVSVAGIATLMRRAEQLVPSLMDAEWNRAWAGLRPQTPHGLPYMGEHPQCKGLFIAAGHYRNGILLSPLTGILIANLIAGKKPGMDLTAFAVPETIDFAKGV